MNCISRRNFLQITTGATTLALLQAVRTARAGAGQRSHIGVALLDARAATGAMAFARQLEDAFARAFPGGPRLTLENIPHTVQSDPPALAATLADPRFDIVLTVGEKATKAAAAARHARPIIFSITVDPIRDRIVASAQAPGSNLTGFTSFSPTHLKRWEILLQAFPDVERLAVFVDRRWPHLPDLEMDGRRQQPLGRRIDVVGIDVYGDILKQLGAHVKHRGLAIDIPHTPVTSTNPFGIIDLINDSCIPCIYDGTHYVRWGGLLSYEADPLPEVETTLAYMTLVLKGIAPGLIPVRYPSSFSLALNTETALKTGLSLNKAALKRINVVIKGATRPLR